MTLSSSLCVYRKSERNLRVVRVQLNSGERIVGVRYPQMLIAVAERELTLPLATTQQQLQLTHTQQLLSDASGNAAGAISYTVDDATGLTTPGMCLITTSLLARHYCMGNH